MRPTLFDGCAAAAAAAGGGGAGAAIAAAEHAALQAEVDGGLAACVHLLHGIDLPWRPAGPWGARIEVPMHGRQSSHGCLGGLLHGFAAG